MSCDPMVNLKKTDFDLIFWGDGQGSKKNIPRGGHAALRVPAALRLGISVPAMGQFRIRPDLRQRVPQGRRSVVRGEGLSPQARRLQGET